MPRIDRHRINRILVVLVLAGVGAYIAAIAIELNFRAADVGSVHIDFVAIWAAAKLAASGMADAAFDKPVLVAQQLLPPGAVRDDYHWHYPPVLQILITPLGFLGFSLAFLVYTSLTLGLFIWAVRRFSAPVPPAIGLILASPPVLFVLVTGNPSLLWVAFLLFALSFQARSRPLEAGLMIALLTFKPQLGLMIPFALLAEKRWREIFWSTFAVFSLVVITIEVFGVKNWAGFFYTVADTTEVFRKYGQNAVTMISWYAFSRQFGLDHQSATVVQVASLVVSSYIVVIVWRRPGVSQDLKFAILCHGTITATPYAFQYELVFAVIAAMFLARAGVATGFFGCLWLAALWALPLPGWLIDGVEIAQYAAPALTLSLILCVAVAFLSPVSTGASPSNA